MTDQRRLTLGRGLALEMGDSGQEREIEVGVPHPVPVLAPALGHDRDQDL